MPQEKNERITLVEWAINPSGDWLNQQIPFSFPLSLNSFSLGNQLNQIHCAKTLFDSMIDWNELNCGNGIARKH